jgi:ABC-type molybdate transport system substrate-binding protein
VYEIQAAGSLAQTSVGDQADLSNTTAGSTTTGLSQCTLSTSLAGSGSTAQMKIVDLAPYPDNAWGDAYTIVRVQINKSQNQATVNAF